jgi:hypothetical protein
MKCASSVRLGLILAMLKLFPLQIVLLTVHSFIRAYLCSFRKEGAPPNAGGDRSGVARRAIDTEGIER